MMARIQSGRAHFWAIFQVAIQPPYLRTLRVEPPFLSILISTGSFSPRDFFTYTLASFHSMVARESLPGIVAVNDMRSPLKPGGSSMFARLRSTALSFQCSESIVVYSSSSILKCYTNHCKLSCNLLPLPTLSNVFALLGRGFLCCCCCSCCLLFGLRRGCLCCHILHDCGGGFFVFFAGLVGFRFLRFFCSCFCFGCGSNLSSCMQVCTCRRRAGAAYIMYIKAKQPVAGPLPNRLLHHPASAAKAAATATQLAAQAAPACPQVGHAQEPVSPGVQFRFGLN